MCRDIVAKVHLSTPCVKEASGSVVFLLCYMLTYKIEQIFHLPMKRGNCVPNVRPISTLFFHKRSLHVWCHLCNDTVKCFFFFTPVSSHALHLLPIFVEEKIPLYCEHNISQFATCPQAQSLLAVWAIFYWTWLFLWLVFQNKSSIQEILECQISGQCVRVCDSSDITHF